MRWSFLLLLSATAFAEQPPVFHPDQQQAVVVSPGVLLKELTGRTAQPGANSDKVSVAHFRLEPGKASAWSHTKVGEESFFILKGRGEIRTGAATGTVSQPVRAGSFVVVPPSVIRSIKASDKEALEFYAITAPAWSSEDDVLVAAPLSAPEAATK